MIKPQQIIEVISKGIAKFAKTYDVPAASVQLGFRLDAKENMVYFTSIDDVPRNTVKLSDLIGNNIYNSIVNNHIKKLIQKFSVDSNISLARTNLVARIKHNNVQIELKNENHLIREINAEELKT